VLQIVQPGLAGLMDGSVSTLAPVFAAAFATHDTWAAFVVGLAASVGAGISMGFAEALSDDGSLTGRGYPWLRGLVCGLMTTLGGIGHTLPYLLERFTLATTIAVAVVLVELSIITWVRHRYMETPIFSAAVQVALRGPVVFFTGVVIGRWCPPHLPGMRSGSPARAGVEGLTSAISSATPPTRVRLGCGALTDQSDKRGS